MSLVRVWTDVGARKPVALLAKIVERDGVIFTIRYLSESDDKIWRYEEDTYDVDDDSIAEYLNTNNEGDVGFASDGSDGFVKIDQDEDYVPSSEEDEESDDEESVCDSGEESESEESLDEE